MCAGCGIILSYFNGASASWRRLVGTGKRMGILAAVLASLGQLICCGAPVAVDGEGVSERGDRGEAIVERTGLAAGATGLGRPVSRGAVNSRGVNSGLVELVEQPGRLQRKAYQRECPRASNALAGICGAGRPD
jgi:hypothetical protein